jgi:hypothetical protein
VNDALKKSAPWLLGLAAFLAALLFFRRRRDTPADPLSRSVTPPRPRRRRTIREVLAATKAGAFLDWVAYETISEESARAIDARTGQTLGLAGFRRTLVAQEVQHALKRHGADPRPVTEADIAALREMLACPLEQRIEKRKGRSPDVLVSKVQRDGVVFIVEEVRRGKQRLNFLTIYRP